MECQQCHSANPENNQFCRKCGNRLSPRLSPMQRGSGNRRPLLREVRLQGPETAKPPPFDYSGPQSYTPKFLADKILTSRSSIEGERKLVTVLFAKKHGPSTRRAKKSPGF